MRKSCKKVMAGTLGVCMLAIGVPGVIEFEELVHNSEVVYAATSENVVSGQCGETATWQYDAETKVLTVSGSGVMSTEKVETYYDYEDDDEYYYDYEDDDEYYYDYEDDDGYTTYEDNRPWIKYKKEVEKVVIGNEITEIGKRAFEEFTSLKTVELGESIRKIDEKAFYGCTALEEINIGDLVEGIASQVFYNCKSLKSVTIGKSLKTMENGVFGGCIGLEKIEIDQANEYFKMKDNGLVDTKETRWYGGCFTTDTTCHVSDNIDAIDWKVIETTSTIENFEVSSGNKTFSSKDGLLYSKDGTELYLCPLGKKGTATVQDATTTIGEYSSSIFKNCAEIEKIVLGKNVKKLEFSMEGCTKLKEIEVSKKNQNYSSAKGSVLSKDGKILLYCVSTDNGTYKIPDGVERIDDFAFYRSHDGSYSSNEPTIAIEHLIFPDSLKDGHFDDGDGDYWIDFKGIKTITLGKNYYDGKYVPWINKYLDNSNLEAVYVSKKNPYYSSVDGILYNKKKTKLIFCPVKVKVCKMPKTVTSVYGKAFCDNPEKNCLEELYVSDAVKDITGGEWVFGWNLKKLHLGKKVKKVNLNMYAKGLEKLTVSSKNKTYKAVDNVLYTKNGKKLLYCPKKKSGSVTVCNGTTTIGASAFVACKTVTEIKLPASVKKVGKNAFKRIADNAVFKVPAGKKKVFKKLLTSKTGFVSTMTIKEEE